ncbi:1480_t:CDS:2, partial [Paraglomus occultum]
MAMGGSRDDVIIWLLLCGKLLRMSTAKSHYTNFLDRIMKGLFGDPDKHVVQWPNTALNESKTRKAE